jgi:hypothetical protein
MQVDEKGLEAVARALCRSKQKWGDTAAVTEQYIDTFWRDYLPDAEVAITAYLSASAEPVVEFKLVKRPVAFRVKASADTGWQHLYYRDEQNAAEAAEQIGVDYEGLYVRDGTPLYTHPGAPNV